MRRARACGGGLAHTCDGEGVLFPLTADRCEEMMTLGSAVAASGVVGQVEQRLAQ